MSLQSDLIDRILILDGAMGTMIQNYKLQESDYRGEEFKNYPSDLKGNNDLLSITQPQIITEIHLKYLEAGSDIIETNTFSSTSIAMADYNLENQVYELNKQSVLCAKKAIELYKSKYPNSKQKYIAGAIGPLNKTLSLSPDINNPGFRAITFNDAMESYYEQVASLVENGADILLIETIFDTLNAKAAIFAIKKYFNDTLLEPLPIMISGTLTDASGRTLSGQTMEAFYISIKHAQPISVGLNCALGAKEMQPYIKELSKIVETFTSAYPNAGLPNAMGEYDESPEITSSFLGQWASQGWVNIVGGCCGSTPAHIEKIAQIVKDMPPRKILNKIIN